MTAEITPEIEVSGRPRRSYGDGMATSRSRKSASRSGKAPPRSLWVRLRRVLLRAVLGVVAAVAALILLFAVVNPRLTPYMVAEAFREGEIRRDWVPMERIAPEMARAAVAAEDANFCLHWGLDLAAIRAALEAGSSRGASTISQQTVKNVFLWHGRSYARKALEALLTPLVEAVWTKRRILEVYLNVAEFDRGVFGVEAAARHYFGVSAADLSAQQAARLAAVLPNPKGRSAADPSVQVQRRATAIRDGAATIAADGRDDCFE